MNAAGASNPAGASATLLEDYDAANVRPWPHQLDAIRAIQKTKSQRCLVQHAAGSGKSLTIAGLASSLADDGFRVVVICDRRQLDAQIYATVRRVCQRRHSVGRASSVADLAASTETVLCTTLQKVSRASHQTRHCKTAVLVDECHRSYADENVWRRLDEALGAPSLVVRFRAQIRFDASARWRDGVDCTQVGFTATPEDRELATLGNPLHCFPLSSAIQHGFVLDVLRDFRAPRLPVTVLDAVSKRPVDDARLRRLALETNAVRFPSLHLRLLDGVKVDGTTHRSSRPRPPTQLWKSEPSNGRGRAPGPW
jgi:type I site-specific restriction-modification system R (restriction) subunit